MVAFRAVSTLSLAHQIRDVLTSAEELCEPTLLIKEPIYASPVGL